MRGVRRPVALAAFAFAVVAVVAQTAAADDPLRLTKPVQATKFDLNPGRTYLAPWLAVDPEDELHVLGAFSDVRTKRCGLMRSTDGGESWTLVEGSPSPASYPFCLMTNSHTFQGKVEFGRDGAIYYALSGWDTQDAPRRSVFVARSTDLGRSWTQTAVADARPTKDEGTEDNRPISGFAVDRRTGGEDSIYLAWRRMLPNTNPRVANQAVVSASNDGGKTFQPPVNLSDLVWRDQPRQQEALASAPTTTTTVPAPPGEIPAATTSTTSTTTPPPVNKDRFGGSNPSVAVDDEGTVYAAWVTSYQGLTQTPSPAHFLAKSTDKGRSFTLVGPITPFSQENTNNFGGTVLAWSPQGGAEGSLHFVYEGSRQPEVRNTTDIFYRRSTDGGRTWTPPHVLNDDDPQGYHPQVMPNITVAPDGRLDAVWWDTRDDPGVTVNDVYYTSSSDNGQTWSKNTRVTTESVNRKIGPFASNFDLNSPPGLASADSYTLVGWDDTRFGNPVTETQDIFTSAVQYRAVGGTSPALTYTLWAVIGLLAVGVLLTVVAVVTRRRGTDPPRPPAETRREAQRIS